MKTHCILSQAARLFMIVSVAGFVCLFQTHAYAGPSAVVKKANTAASILVTVPADGKAVTYVLGDRTWRIEPGQTRVLPVGATKIKLPMGTILTAVMPSAKSMEPVKNVYTVKDPITLDALTPEAIAANADSIVPGIQPTGDTGPTIADLINAVTSASTTTVNPINVMGDAVTDGNQP